MSPLHGGDRVTWTLQDGTRGAGEVIDVRGEKALVAVDPLQRAPGLRQASLEFHPVIWCTVTWLTVAAPPPKA